MYKIINHPNNLRLIEFSNQNNFHVILSNYGASIYQIATMDLKGNLETVTLTPLMTNFLNNSKYCGLTIGRVAGRIPNATFMIKNKTYQIESNEKSNLLHSGNATFAHKFFDFIVEDNKEYTKVIYSLFVEDMKDGFPGDLQLEVSYTLYKTIDGIDVDYKAISSKDTFLNITNHSYFNLSGDLKYPITGQVLRMNKTKRALLNEDLIPQSIIDVEKEYDFTKGMKIGTYLQSQKVLTSPAGGYDDIFTSKEDLKLSLYDPRSGRKLDIESNYHDCVIYTNNVPANIAYLTKIADEPYLGIAIEPSRAANVLKPHSFYQQANALYNYYIKYRFTLKEEI